MFRRQPAGRTHIRVCRTLSCAMAGSYELMDQICAAAGIQRDGHDHENPIAVSPDGKYSVEFVECLASCGTAPVAMSGDDFHERVTAESIPQLLDSTGSSATLPKIHPPHRREKRIVFQNIDREGWSNDIEKYLLYGGYEDLKKALSDASRRTSSTRSRLPACAAAAAPASRAASNGDSSSPANPSRFTSSATPTNPNRAPSRTATSSTRTRISSSRG